MGKLFDFHSDYLLIVRVHSSNINFYSFLGFHTNLHKLFPNFIDLLCDNCPLILNKV
jgi:hypothetical protein